MFVKLLTILLFVGLLTIKVRLGLITWFVLVIFILIQTTNANEDVCNVSQNVLSTLSSLAKSIARIVEILAADGFKSAKKYDCEDPPPAPVVDKCENLKNGTQYYLKTADGKFVVVDAFRQLGYILPTGSNTGSKFTATQLGCNLYGLCVDGFCMSRCMGCTSDIGEMQTVKFHLNNSDEPYSRWTFSSAGSDGVYDLKIDEPYGYLAYKKTTSGKYQLGLAKKLSNETKFQFVEAK